jgi:hypothetical protein
MLTELPANTWANIPSPSSGKMIADYKVLNSVGSDITDALEFRLVSGQWQVRSLTNLADVQFVLEVV